MNCFLPSQADAGERPPSPLSAADSPLRASSPLRGGGAAAAADADPEHEQRLAFLAAEGGALVESLSELCALQQGGQAAFSDAATGLQHGADALRELSEALAEGRGGGDAPAGAQEPLEEVRAREGRKSATGMSKGGCDRLGSSIALVHLAGGDGYYLAAGMLDQTCIPHPRPPHLHARPQALQEADSVLCTLGALQMEDLQRPVARTSRALRALCAQLQKAPGPQALAGGSCFKATIEVRRGR